METVIKVAGLDYAIKEFTEEQMGWKIGFADFNQQLIAINSKHTEQTKKIAIYHEIIHILSDAYGLKLTEEQVKIGTHALIAFLSDNKEFKQL